MGWSQPCVCVFFFFVNYIYGIRPIRPQQKIRLHSWTRRWIRSLKQWSWSRCSGSIDVWKFFLPPKRGEEITSNMCFKNATRSQDDMRVESWNDWNLDVLVQIWRWSGYEKICSVILFFVRTVVNVSEIKSYFFSDVDSLCCHDSSRAVIWMES